ncbi:MAG: PAS domain S-box protein [bacterium]|nr:PAS domain S-box protein [bacterium]
MRWIFLSQRPDFETVVESMNEGLIIGSLDRTILFVNQQLATMCGYTSEELLGKPSEILIARMNATVLESGLRTEHLLNMTNIRRHL